MAAIPHFQGAIPSDAETITAFSNSPQGFALLKNGTAFELLSYAMGLCKEELRALQCGYVDVAAANYAVRFLLINQALDRHNETDTGNFKQLFMEMDTLQETLIEEAQSLQKRMRVHMNNTKGESNRLNAYQKTLTIAS